MKFRCVLTPVLLVLLLVTLFLAAACTGKETRSGGSRPRPRVAPNAGIQREISAFTGPVWPALAMLRTGENPLWFELGPGGPELIQSPDQASLIPYTPWPNARFVTGIQRWDGFLVMAINRDGFLVLGLGETTASAGNSDDTAAAVLYRVTGNGLWDPYTAESFFIWKDKPAVLLYRNDFFIETSASSLRPQVYFLDRSSAAPLGVSIPALEHFPSDGPWEAEVVRRGADGLWYYRMREKGKDQNETAYFRTRNLAEKGESISADEWWKSNLPENPENIPSSSLPPLPEGFVYTGVALLGGILLASWEEQQEAGIGAAGFMVIKAGW